MFGIGVKSKLKSIDMYRKLPTDLTESTVSGAMISIASSLIMLILFISEFNGYLSITETSEMYIDEKRYDKIRINIDIDYPRLPCDVISLDVEDLKGTHSYQLEGNIQITRISNTNQYFDTQKYDDSHSENNQEFSEARLNRLKSAFLDQEGCKIQGHIFVNKAPGNFHVSAHSFDRILHQIASHVNISTIDVSHIINHISFGDETDIIRIKRQFKSQGILDPLDRTRKIKTEDQKNISISYQYYINVVHTTYVNIQKKEYSVYQFTANNNELLSDRLPACFFRYDLSPVIVRFSQSRMSFLHFIVQVCAIIGGVFTVAGIIDSIIHKSVVHILKKAEMGKLS
ncbi:hypothetical protein IMG5_153610 [Ichthyophthirius multifiliis]|uniref:Uncharacterized protein n=1 Tax=Ichthyophthirius multifiliis TaxID=5932 RepID=G0QZ09_ICHMU|nr:hypothetical protein IMG5_153610 [Ichthyophthirius multifiliis]EGR29544.1 hypothetical protein IMG5_153610 [Ichthyophthirius multifiliis]|eukprot:XP_004030780.1 hypothetical protein IMG5_153610 [Ichthyophthirius multifiliis]